mgnify:FL=1
MNKAHSAINWENYPSDETPLNESNLNKMDAAIGVIDDRVITLDTTKATKTEVATLVADVTFEESTGIITITKKNGSKITIDTQMEKIAINFDYNPTTQQIILTLIDGTKQYIDLSALITQYEFLDSDTVAFYIDKDGKVSAIVKEGSIEEKHLEPNYLAKIKVEVAKAGSSQQAAAKSEANAKASEYAAKASETAAKTSETNGKVSETAAAKSATAAAISETNAKASETSASQSAATATSEAASASQSASTATDKATIATQKATEIIGKAESAADSATKAQSYAVGGTGSREGEDSDNAKYYYQQAKDVSEGLKGGLQPHGTVSFADLPALADVSTGWMFNISDEFTTTDDFKEGAGNTVPAGANIYKTSDGKWDVLAGTPVTGIKGAKETSYRRGNVNLTPVDIGAYAIEAIDEMMKKVSIPLSQELAVVGTEDDQLIVEESSGWQTVNYLEGISGSLKTIAQQLMALNSGLTNHINNVMQAQTSSIYGTQIAIPNNTQTLVNQLEVKDDGLYLIRSQCTFVAASVGYRDVSIKVTDKKTNMLATRGNANTIALPSPVQTCLQCQTINALSLHSGDKIGLYANQNSGATLNVSESYISITRLK